MIVTFNPDKRRYEATAQGDHRKIRAVPGWSYSDAFQIYYTKDRMAAARMVLIARTSELLRRDLAPELTIAAEEPRLAARRLELSRATDANIEIPKPDGINPFTRKPFEYLDYQKAGVAFTMACNRHTLISDEPGLGKTIMAIAVGNMLERCSVLIIAPAFLKIMWERQWRAWDVHNRVVGIAGDSFPRSEVVIINYDILKTYYQEIREREWGLLIVDECHMVINMTANRTQQIFGVEERKERDNIVRAAIAPITAAREVFLTGTPLVNKPFDLWPVVQRMDPEDLGRNLILYGLRYCQSRKKRFGWEHKGAANLDELQVKLRSTCVTGDTLIYSEYGNIAIESIVQRKLPIRVWTRNRMGRLSLQPIVGFSQRTHSKFLIKICHAEGQLVCTPDHRIYVDKKYKRADEITTHDRLCILPKEKSAKINHEQSYSGKSNLLLNSLRRSSNAARTETKVCTRKEQSPQNNRSYLRTMSEGICGLQQDHISQAEILHNYLPCPMELSALWPLSTSFIQECYRKTKGEANRKKNTNSETNVRDEAFAGNAQKDVRYLEGEMGARACDRQRGNIEATIAANSSKIASHQKQGAQIVSGASRSARGFYGCRNEYSGEDDIRRYSHTGGKLDNRSRWASTCLQGTKNKRQRARSKFSFARVQSVEILELGDYRISSGSTAKNITVYDIEVANNHNFFANNVLVHNCMVRRRKADVLKSLPPKRRQVIEVPRDGFEMILADEDETYKRVNTMLAEQRALVERARDGSPEAYKAAVNELRRVRGIGFTEMARVRKAVGIAKIPFLVEFTKDAIAADGKVVLFAHHHEIIDAVGQAFGRAAVVVDGRIKDMEERQRRVDRFQEDPNCELFMGSIGAAGVGWTLTASYRGIVGEMVWTPKDMTQAEDRLHRFGQQYSVLIQHLVIDGSMDSNMIKVVVAKQDITDQALDQEPSPEALQAVLQQVQPVREVWDMLYEDSETMEE